MSVISTNEVPLTKTSIGQPFPAAPGHSTGHEVTVHMPKWPKSLHYLQQDAEPGASLSNNYPRLGFHRKVVEATGALLLPTREAQEACLAFAIDSTRNKNAIPEGECEPRVFDIAGQLFFAILYPKEKKESVFQFWNNTGMIISSRLAEYALDNFHTVKEVGISRPSRAQQETQEHDTIRKRIASFIERAPRNSADRRPLASSDVYLYQSGMAAIYNIHHYLNTQNEGTHILFSFAFESTPLILEWFSKKHKIFGRGTELDKLDDWAQYETSNGRPIRAIWLEFPSNPILTTADLVRLREIATKHDALLIVDETISSFANIDLFGPDGVDISVCSLSKSFNGYADLLAGAAILNPSAGHYSALKPLLDQNHINLLYSADAKVLEANSRDYLTRSAILNRNAQAIVSFLVSRQASDTNTPIARVHHPSNPEYKANFDAFKRTSTEEFTPGYGCLLNVELKTVSATASFHDSLCETIHVGPHLGAHLTCALAYSWVAYGDDMSRVSQYGLNERQIRVSAGLEQEDALIKVFERAYDAAREAMGGL